jgi:hypothetical protein
LYVKRIKSMQRLLTNYELRGSLTSQRQLSLAPAEAVRK